MTKPRRTTSTVKRDVHQDVTDSIIAALETCGDWSRPWTSLSTSASCPRSIDGRRYRGVNVILLWAEAMDKGYEHGVWGTYQAWKSKGGQVRKGEKGTDVVLVKRFERDATDEDRKAGRPISKDGKVSIQMLRFFSVFNVAQQDGYELPAQPESAPVVEVIEEAAAYFTAIGANVRTLPGGRAYYDMAADRITVPSIDDHTSAERYYAVLAHEHGHWTGHASRLARDLKNHFGSEAYAGEELVAELTAAFVCAGFGMHADLRDDHASYVKSWLKALRNDKRAIFTAASAAQKATDYLATAAGATADLGDDDEGSLTLECAA